MRTMLYIALETHLFAERPSERLTAARRASRFAKRGLLKRTNSWPPSSPGALNAWLLLVSTKPPSWRDPIIQWRELPPSLGDPHEGFFYPDPLGFWVEVRRWASLLVRLAEPTFSTADALAVTALLHVGDDASRLKRAMLLCRPKVVLFLDEPAWAGSGLKVKTERHYVPDPHREQQVYEGFWGETENGLVVGKAPQHPAAHRLYKQGEMDGFLRSAPVRPTQAADRVT